MTAKADPAAPRALTAEETAWIEEWLPSLPKRVAREAVYVVLGGLIKPATLSCCDSLGNGPPIRFKIGKKVIYDTRVLLEWIVRRDGLAVMKDHQGMVADLLDRKEPPRRKPAKTGASARSAGSSRGSCAA